MSTQGSCTSIFSGASDTDIVSCNMDRDVLTKLREKLSVSIELIAVEVGKMLSSCDVQQNVNMMIKDRLKSLISLMQDFRSTQTEAGEK